MCYQYRRVMTSIRLLKLYSHNHCNHIDNFLQAHYKCIPAIPGYRRSIERLYNLMDKHYSDTSHNYYSYNHLLPMYHKSRCLRNNRMIHRNMFLGSRHPEGIHNYYSHNQGFLNIHSFVLGRPMYRMSIQSN